ncbi:MAG: type II secretion system F family protein [Candidatus Andersenbacteria bacterium]|nr:type II secretion system F family protein [Candidatus Andersenbacteria bacterium]
MPIYAFEGRNEQTGEIVNGMREVASHAMLGQDLLAEGILLTRDEERKQRLPGATILSALFTHVPILEKLLFARYFALMLRAGLDVKRSLAALTQQSRSKPMKGALEHVIQGVERGDTLADSMAVYYTVFSPLFVSFVRVGESTGRLQESLELLAVQLQKEYELKRAVRGGMMYPIVILVALIAVGFAMMVFVIPKLTEVFEGFNVELPLTTRVLIGISSVFEKYWYLILAGMVVLVFGCYSLLKVRAVKEVALHTLLYTPVIGPIMQKINLARFSRNLSSLLSSGVSFIESLDILGANTPHPSYAKILIAAKEHVKQGKALSDFLQDFVRLFPPLVTNIIKVGEETGQLDTVLKEVALFYEGEVDQTMKNLTSIMEPILMVGIGLAVGALAISIISPIYNLVNVI